jgi:hypothetical protein
MRFRTGKFEFIFTTIIFIVMVLWAFNSVQKELELDPNTIENKQETK